MKYVVVLGDGMSDRPLAELGGQTPLAYANTPMMDELSPLSEIGMVQTIPEGMKPGSDTANLSVLGYDPKIYYSGRSPLEALSIGVDLKDTDVAVRCNIVTLSEEEETYADRIMIDHSSDEITTQEANELMNAVRDAFNNETFSFYTGTSYRHLLVWDHGSVIELAQPHDILTQRIGEYLPAQEQLRAMMEKSYEILKDHPVNASRRQRGLHPANSCWFWGAGTRPALDSFEKKYHKRGAVISAVDLLKGIAVGAGMKPVIVPGADGSLHTNYAGKAQAAVDVLTKEAYDFVYVHVEAPDEMGHQGSIQRKVLSIEYLDEKLIRPIKEGLDKCGEDYRMLILPDHPTPIETRTHASEAVPYLLYDSTAPQAHTWNYNEAEATGCGRHIERGWELMEYFFSK